MTDNQINFINKHADNTIDRTGENILAEMAHALSSAGYEPVGKPWQRDGQWMQMVDVKNVDGYDHIEVTLTVTGWGREA